ncbi:MAG: TlpA disulfide reductase family protein [Thermoanaerobaculia bacterium]
MRRTGPPAWKCLAVVAALAGACGAPEPYRPLRAGDPAPVLSLPSLDGERFTLEADGRPVLVVFWATWCAPCLEEIPLLEELHAAGAARVVSVALDEEGEGAVAPFAAERGLPYPVLLGDEETFRRYDGLAIPYTVVLDGALHVVSTYRGRLDPEEIERRLARAAARAEGTTDPHGG